MFPHHEQVDECGGDIQPVGVLLDASLAQLGEADLQFHYCEHMLDPRQDLRHGPVLRPLCR